ncbi:contractile injection system protein, VgrG/Pvc8 family [Paenibacillus sp. FSL W8-0919]|uniref:contractile injection system protein, VgrG/Pvc8 family n=1 Tax=Paenibacillus sp. FSL W8-0919 TaxID=2954707 RepID=UPI0030F8DD9F
MGTAVKRSGYGEVQLVSPFDIQTLHELTIERRVNEHAVLRLTGTIPEEQQEACIEIMDADNNVKVNLMRGGSSVLPLFCGVVTDLAVRHVRGIYYVELEALSLSSLLDVQLKSRSFQDISMTYDALLDQVLGDYPGSDVINMEEDADRLEQFTLQYRETDWQFLKRLASRFASVLVPEAAADSGPKLWFGLPEGRSGVVLEDGVYGASRRWDRRGPDGGVLGDLDDAPETRYAAYSDEVLNLGDRVQFQGQELVVTGSTATMDGGQFRFEYLLMPEDGIRQKPLYNTALVGASLEGRILEVKQDTVRLHLDIDAAQEKEAAAWFPYTSVYTAEGNSGFYCMPQAGDAVQLYIPDFREEKAIAQGSVRKGGATSPKTQDPSMKTWGTNHGKEMQMGPSHMSLIAKEGSLFINLDAGEGIQIVSDTTLIIAAEQDIELSAEKKLEITAEEAIYLLCKESSVILDGKADIQGTEIKLEGLIKGPVYVPDLPPVPEPEDPPLPQPPPKKEKKGFWGKLLDGVQLVLDVAGMVPGIGEIADLANAAIYTARGDYTNAALSAAAAIPFAGWAATGAKFVNKGGKALDAMSTAAKYADNAADAVKAVDKAADVATTAGKLGSSAGKVTTAARKLEDVQKQMDAVQTMKAAMKNMAVGVGQDMAMQAGLGVLGEYIGEDYAMAVGMAIGYGRFKRKSGAGSQMGITSGGGGGGGGNKPKKDKGAEQPKPETKPKDKADTKAKPEAKPEQKPDPKQKAEGKGKGDPSSNNPDDFSKQIKKLDEEIERLIKEGNDREVKRLKRERNKLANKLDTKDVISDSFDLEAAKEYERKIDNSKYFSHDKGDFGEEVTKIVARDSNLGQDVSDLFQVGRNGIDAAFLSKGPPPKLTIIESKASDSASFSYSDKQKQGGDKYFQDMINSDDPRYADFSKKLRKLKKENPGLEFDFIRVETDIKITETGFGVDELKIKDWNKEID